MKGGQIVFFFFSSRRRHTRSLCDWSSDVCSSDLGRGYLRFAFAEPGLFRTAFHHVEMPESPEGHPATDGTDDFRSFELLSSALDDLLTTGLMPPARRPGAEIAAWSAVHGLAVLVIDGPLNWLKGPTLDAAVEALLRSIAAGLCAP